MSYALPEDFRRWDADAKREFQTAYLAQDGSGISYKDRLRLAENIVRERHLRAAEEKSEAVKHETPMGN